MTPRSAVPIEFRFEALQEAVAFYGYGQEDLIGGVDALKSNLVFGINAAGSDTPGMVFSFRYDPAAQTCLEVTCGVVNASGTMHDLLMQTAFNYAAANDAYDRAEVQDDRAVPSWSAPIYFVSRVPSIEGGAVSNPGWWSKIQGLIGGKLYPQANEELLGELRQAWLNGSGAIMNNGCSFARGLELATSTNIPEQGSIRAQGDLLADVAENLASETLRLSAALGFFGTAVKTAKMELDLSVKPVVEAADALDDFPALSGFGLGGRMALRIAAARASQILTRLEGRAADIAVGDADDIFDSAKGIEGLLGASLVPARRDMSDYPIDEHDPAKRRVTLRESTKEAIRERMRSQGLVTADGNFIDPNTFEVIPKGVRSTTATGLGTNGG